MYGVAVFADYVVWLGPQVAVSAFPLVPVHADSDAPGLKCTAAPPQEANTYR